MHSVRKVTDDLYWVGANDHRLTLFENIHPIPQGVSYNAYLLKDEQTVLFDTVDWSGMPPAAGKSGLFTGGQAAGCIADQSYGA